KNAFETVLRDAMTTDNCDPAGIYFGTRSGELYGSLDDGRTWQKILEGLPSILCVRAGSTGHNSRPSHQAAAADASPTSAPSAPSSRTRTSRSAKKRERS
ncbi:MAG TPA: hypothetical protein VJV22_01550, partial [Acidobacteriaceae bacterium]|nr:hypothetical protein [Acidobacteriaceae bacterium]